MKCKLPASASELNRRLKAKEFSAVELTRAFCDRAFGEAVRLLKSFGMPFKEVALPDFPYGPVGSTIVSCEGGSMFEELITSGKVDELADQRQAQGLKAALEIPAKDYLKAMRIRTLIQQAFREMFVDIDILVAPARTSIASRVTESLDRLRRGGPNKGLGALTGAGNLAGLPALCLPCGFAEKMPVGIQLVGRPFSENLLLKVGMEFQAKSDWHKQRPPVLEASNYSGSRDHSRQRQGSAVLEVPQHSGMETERTL